MSTTGIRNSEVKRIRARRGNIRFYADPDLRRRYYDHKEDARKRLGWKELTNDEFLTALLDVYALHLERDVPDGELP